MANEPNEVRDVTIRRLRTEQEKEYQLVNNLLSEITCYMLQKLDRAEEETRVRSLPFDEPLKSFSLQTLRMSSESDTRISTSWRPLEKNCSPAYMRGNNSSRITEQSNILCSRI
ncbi:hypothetical protein Tco_0944275, partial [Tanacetum coccineum]